MEVGRGRFRREWGGSKHDQNTSYTYMNINKSCLNLLKVEGGKERVLEGVNLTFTSVQSIYSSKKDR
jgi:hypothetical protein